MYWGSEGPKGKILTTWNSGKGSYMSGYSEEARRRKEKESR